MLRVFFPEEPEGEKATSIKEADFECREFGEAQ
jgi:hypothetical protein